MENKIKEPFAFVDGSYNPKTKVYGYGGFVQSNGKRYLIRGSGHNEELATMRNVAGEIAGSMMAVQKAEKLGLSSLCILYDYRGIEDWVTGKWQAKKEGTIQYRDYMRSKKKSMNITFEKVAAHTGIEGNEIADILAKTAVGVELTKSQQAIYDQLNSKFKKQ